MNNISLILAKLRFQFDNPLFLLVLIPGVILAFWPYFRIRKDKRRTRERIVSMILHLVILLLASFVLAGFTIHEDQTLKSDEVLILIDVSDSNYANSDNIAKYVNDVIDDSDPNVEVGFVYFGVGKPEYVEKKKKPKISVSDIYRYYDNPVIDKEDGDEDDGFVMTTGTDMARAISFAITKFDGYERRFEVNRPLDGCRIVLISDGIETDGNATSAAAQAASLGATIDSVYFAPKDYSETNDVQLESVKVDEKKQTGLTLDTAISVDVTIKARKPGNGAKATLEFFDYNAKDPDKSTKISAGENGEQDLVVDITAPVEVHSTSIKFNKSGVHTIKVQMTTNVETEEDFNNRDALRENNVYYTYVIVQETTNKVLIIDGSGTGATAIKSMVESIKDGAPDDPNYEATVVTPDKAPFDLSKYGEVILVNVNTYEGEAAGKKLPKSYDQVLRTYVNNGGGLFTIGGKDTYYNGGMNRNAFNEFLPVKVKPEPSTSKEVILLIDRSSAMCGKDNDWFDRQFGKSRLKVVQEAIRNCLTADVFSPNDYIGVIFFGGNAKEGKNASVDMFDGLISAAEILTIDEAFTDAKFLEKSGMERTYMGSTEWRHALEDATEMLQGSQVGGTNHIIMITDGAGDKIEGESSRIDSYPNGCWKVYAESYNGQTIPSGVPEKCYTDYILDKYQITTSVINVGNKLSPAASYMEMMETTSQVDPKGMSHYYYVETADEILQKVELECRNIPTEIINEGEDIDRILTLQDDALLDIALNSDLPLLGGYNGVTVKEPDAAALIQTAKKKDPIYAEWAYGSSDKKGIVGSLMTDITTEWGSSLIAEGSKAREVIKYLIDGCFTSGDAGSFTDMDVVFDAKNFTTTVTINNIKNGELLPIKDDSGKYVGEVGEVDLYYLTPDDLMDFNGTGSVNEFINERCKKYRDEGKYENMNFSADTFTNKFKTTQEGLYVVAFLRLGKADGGYYYIDDELLPFKARYVTFSYSDEYDTYYDAEKSLATLQNICNSASGKVYYYGIEDMEQNIFSNESQYTSKTIDPVVALMLVALILFILDVCARKFHFLWPHEWFKKKDDQVK